MATRQGGRGGRQANSQRGLKFRSQPSSQRGPRGGTGPVKWHDIPEFLPSISRSGGDNGQGDTMKDSKVQDRYWQSMEEKILEHWRQYPDPSVHDDQARRERESNLLLQIRKLREGILASHRKDSLALSVYESSFYLALCFDSTSQVLASESHLIELYKYLVTDEKPASSATIRSKALVFCTIALAFHLTEAYPSQTTYFQFLNSISSLIGEADNQELLWLTSLRKSMNTKNYSEVSRLIGSSHVSSVIEHLSPESQLLPRVALNATMDRLRSRLRDSTWSIVRASYRELALDSSVDTANWLSQILMLDSKPETVDHWIKRRVEEGDLVAKEGSKTRYSIRKPV